MVREVSHPKLVAVQISVNEFTSSKEEMITTSNGFIYIETIIE